MLPMSSSGAAAARSHAIVLFLLLVVITFSITFSGRLKLIPFLGWIVMLAGIGWVVSSEERLQRFMTLKDTDSVSDRIGISVNKGFLERAIEYPLGNGLGGGGTSLPYFLQDKVVRPVAIESEYGRIMLEQGIPGFLSARAGSSGNVGETLDRESAGSRGDRGAYPQLVVVLAGGPVETGLDEDRPRRVAARGVR